MTKQINNLDSGVYFIYAPNQNKIKIGRSVDIENRYKQLRTGFMDEGSLLIGIITNNEVELEATLHRRFSHLRDNGEWFYMTKELDDFILNCKHDYKNVIVYQNLNEIQSKLSYSSLGLFMLIKIIKNLQNKYLIPIILGVIGLIIAFYNYRFETNKNDPQIIIFVSYCYFIVFPIITPFLSKKIIAHQSILTCILYFGLLFITIIIEVTNFLMKLNPIVLDLFRVFVLSVYLSLTKNLFIIVKAKEANEEIRRNVREGLPQEINDENDFLIVLKYKENAENRIRKIYNIRRLIMIISNIITYLVLHIYMLYISKNDWDFRLFIIIVSNISVFFWFIINLLQKKPVYEKSKTINKLRPWIIPGTIMFINFTLLVIGPNSLFWEFISIFIIWFLPVSIIMLLTMKTYEKNEIVLKEIDTLLTKE